MTPAEDNLIAWLGRHDGEAASLGGKGASLDRLAKLGFRVPPGFCVTTAAFRAAGPVTGADGGDRDESTLGPWVAGALADAVGELVVTVVDAGLDPRFAVRSSAVGEDGSTASYAGLHDTELDVPPQGVAQAVVRCWQSLWSAPATAYRTRRGLSDEDAAMAVVVQGLVPAEAAAVAFTRHPVTGRTDQLVATAVRGLGDAMVSGTVTPDTYVINRARRAVETFEPGEDPRGPALDGAALAALVDLCLEVEARFGQAVDIEAAMTAGTWYLLQARPITTGMAVTA